MEINKYFLICCAISIGILESAADNFFVDGAIWQSREFGAPMPDTPEWDRTVSLSGDTVVDGRQCLRLLLKEDNSNPAEIAFVNITDNKVWFKPSFGTAEWLLMYDFGLAPGEGCTVWEVPCSDALSTNLRSAYLECDSIETTPDGIMMMHMQEYADETKEYGPQEITWIIGGGSLCGVLRNSTFLLDGASSGILLELSVPDKGMVYKSDYSLSVIYHSSIDLAPQKNTIYDLKGRRLEDPVKGSIYISNGKLRIER